EQLAPVIPGRSYEFRYRYRTEGIPAETGVQWRVSNARSGEVPINGPNLSLSSEQWREEGIYFTATGSFARITLSYRRIAGTVRPEGTILLDGAFMLVKAR